MIVFGVIVIAAWVFGFALLRAAGQQPPKPGA